MKRHYLAVLLIFSFLLFQPMVGGQSTFQEHDVEIVQNQSEFGDGEVLFTLQLNVLTFQTENKIGQAGDVIGKNTSISYDGHIQPINSDSMEHLKYAIGWQSLQESPITHYSYYKGQNYCYDKNIMASIKPLKVMKFPTLAV